MAHIKNIKYVNWGRNQEKNYTNSVGTWMNQDTGQKTVAVLSCCSWMMA